MFIGHLSLGRNTVVCLFVRSSYFCDGLRYFYKSFAWFALSMPLFVWCSFYIILQWVVEKCSDHDGWFGLLNYIIVQFFWLRRCFVVVSSLWSSWSCWLLSFHNWWPCIVSHWLKSMAHLLYWNDELYSVGFIGVRFHCEGRRPANIVKCRKCDRARCSLKMSWM